MKRTSVVILNYNGEKLFGKFLPSVLAHSGDAEIIVIDNHSSDQSIQVLKRDYPRVRVITLEKNYGFCGGYNQGLKQVDADFFVLLNSDVEVTAGWLDEPLQLLEAGAGAVQPRIKSYLQRNQFDYAGAGGGFLDDLCYPYCRGRIFNTIENDHNQYNDTTEVAWASGACMFISSALFFESGGFETSFFAHMEEIDLCWRLRRMGKKIMYCGSSIVYHLGGGTLAATSPRKTYLNFRNNLSLMLRNLSTSRLLFVFPLRCWLDGLAALKFLFEGNTGSMLSVCRAHWSFFGSILREWRGRRSLSHLPYILPQKGEIRFTLWNYHFLGKKNYPQAKKN
jgi:GT2 family glycosyltransferase